MANQLRTSSSSDVAILSRLIRPEAHNLPPTAAKAWLAIQFEQPDLDRMHELVTKNQDDKLTAKEKTELENYRRVSFLLDFMHSKARRSLKKPSSAGLRSGAPPCGCCKSTATRP